MVFGNQEICDWPLMTRSWPTCRALSPRLRARSSRETSFASKVTRIYPRRIRRLCPQLRTFMLEVTLGSSAWPRPRHVSALHVFSSLCGLEDALKVIVSAMESTKMATAQVDSMWQKRHIVAHGGEVELCVLGAGPSSTSMSGASPQLRTCCQRRCRVSRRTVSVSQRKRTRRDPPRSSIGTVATFKSDLLVALRELYDYLVCHCQTRKYSDSLKPVETSMESPQRTPAPSDVSCDGAKSGGRRRRG